jgi:hypothetical protein
MLGTVTRNGNEVGRWTAPDLPYEIEVELDVLEEIRHRADEGFQRIGHGGIEFGGVLYGRMESGVVRILEWRELDCDHSMGPSFVLSPADRNALEALIALPEREPSLKPQDVELHEKYFTGAQQVALIVKPARQGPSAAGFFGRKADGVLEPASTTEFEVRANVNALMRAPRDSAAPRTQDAQERVTGPTPLAPPRPIGPRRSQREDHAANGRPARGQRPADAPQTTVIEAHTPAETLPESPLFAAYAEPKRGFRWGLLLSLLLVAALVCAAALLIPRLMSNQPDTAGLRVEESGNLLLVRWDQTIPRLRFADEGIVEINDGGTLQTIRLDREELASGMLTYVRRSGDVAVGLRVRGGGKITLEEVARYLGPSAPARTHAAPPAAELSSQLASDERRVDEALRQEAGRKQRIEEAVRILENRLGRQ